MLCWYNDCVSKSSFFSGRFLLTLALIISFLVTSLLQPLVVSAQTSVWTGNCIANDAGVLGSGDVATIQGLECLIANVLSIAITGIGLVGFVMMLVGAFRYLISGSNTKETETARSTLTYSLIGLVVALSAFIILNLIASFTGVTSILNFQIQVENQASPQGGGGKMLPIP